MINKGFTLIELLIVIAIILILIAIALPNFLEAQIRARVTSALGSMRSMAIAMDEYYLDFRTYPGDHDPDGVKSLHQLTSPIAYMHTIPEDPFTTRSGLLDPGDDEIGWEMASTGVLRAFAHILTTDNNSNVYAFALTSHGPDQADSFSANDSWPFLGRNSVCPGGQGWMTYSATNGSKSIGELVQVGGEHRSGAYCIDDWRLVRGTYPKHVP